jgi:ATP-dependent Clp protease adaptor protein ClpS
MSGPRSSSGDDIDDNHRDGGGSGGTETITRPQTSDQTRTTTPAMYRVLLLNDDFTPMDFVIHVLQKFFQKDYTEATQIMLQVHHQGAGVAGVFSYEIAETKVHQVNQYAKQNRHPLKSTMERA